MTPFSIALIYVNSTYAADVAAVIADNQEGDIPIVHLPKTNKLLVDSDRGDIALASIAHQSFLQEMAYRANVQSYITTAPVILPLSLCGDYLEEVAKRDGSVLTRLAMRRIETTFAHLMVLSDTWKYSGIYLLPLKEATESQRRLEGYIR